MKKIPTHHIIPITPKMLSLFVEVLRSKGANDKESIRVIMGITTNYSITGFGYEEKLSSWLYSEYAAEIVKKDGVNQMRFSSEEQMVMFLLQWG